MFDKDQLVDCANHIRRELAAQRQLGRAKNGWRGRNINYDLGGTDPWTAARITISVSGSMTTG